jgi:hypothetical protein
LTQIIVEKSWYHINWNHKDVIVLLNDSIYDIY